MPDFKKLVMFVPTRQEEGSDCGRSGIGKCLAAWRCGDVRCNVRDPSRAAELLLSHRALLLSILTQPFWRGDGRSDALDRNDQDRCLVTNPLPRSSHLARAGLCTERTGGFPK